MRLYPTKRATFLIPVAATLTTTCGIEISNPAASGKLIRLTRAQWHVGSAMQLTLTRRDAVHSGGTPVSVTPVPARVGETASVAACRYFTAAPSTAGNLLDTPGQYQIPASTFVDQQFGNESGEEITIKPGEVLCFSTGSVAHRSTLTITEEPYPLL